MKTQDYELKNNLLKEGYYFAMTESSWFSENFDIMKKEQTKTLTDNFISETTIGAKKPGMFKNKTYHVIILEIGMLVSYCYKELNSL